MQPASGLSGPMWLISSYLHRSLLAFLPHPSPCRIRSDRQTTSLTLTTGVCEAGTKMRGASNMNIHYDVTGLLTAAWRSHSGQIVWAAWINCELAREEEGGGGFWTHSTYTGYPGSAGGRQLDRWRCHPFASVLWLSPSSVAPMKCSSGSRYCSMHMIIFTNIIYA